MNEETDTTADVRNVVIVGSGVAGLSAAVYAARADLEPLVLEGPEPGGQLTLTTDVENYLGFSEGVGGMELIQNGKDQATAFGAEFTHGTVENATLEERPFELELSNGDTLRTHALIVASGASARWVGADNEDKLMGYGLSTCATCDGAFHRGDDVLVIGGGDSAMEEALFLAKFADSVTVVHRRENLRASEIMADRARDHEDIEFRWNTELEAIHGSHEEGVTGATLVSHPDGYPAEKVATGVDVNRETVDVGGVFYAIGHTPNTEFLEGTAVDRDESGYLHTRTADGRATTETTVEGVFAAGDVADPHYQQAITAAGTGSMAALDAEAYLEAFERTEETALEVSP
ncbi:FAD-dependent pyridine nucleotide-disulphide oxidoreductase (plasmid) [Haloterrigena turkmenica DSM 5511]|uniref:FAD-dependent pyridine nucleotide-disulphide oxidoreductase n=1 Tax=Haloterrigena turkmenica (strain ATCC 51198 / DSM 5511 / JCM 9101 / NCIMB 13204 / VKM B-1734 / 4k) TaxID=543526 RepID=D2S0Z2_HALTV|nr:FAD-dependent oxidoreductase [Haloterrigena turkmenica]ADB63039.1 FAD-dependent pyridine nucleotide-disulphide oxidoreductase [Haloterrigena turkmenica DSM 5511]